jgi:hypothetical protein
MKKILFVLPILAIALMASGCDGNNVADNKEASQVDNQQQIYVNNQPAPVFDWSLERHIMVELYKARNNAVQTYSYVRNLQGQIVFRCKSIGFPLPSNDQLTNSSKLAYPDYNQSPVLPQAEPNGMYSSPSTSGTYVFCINSDGTVSPSYFEADVETHLSPLASDGNTLSGDGDLKINIKK